MGSGFDRSVSCWCLDYPLLSCVALHIGGMYNGASGDVVLLPLPHSPFYVQCALQADLGWSLFWQPAEFIASFVSLWADLPSELIRGGSCCSRSLGAISSASLSSHFLQMLTSSPFLNLSGSPRQPPLAFAPFMYLNPGTEKQNNYTAVQSSQKSLKTSNQTFGGTYMYLKKCTCTWRLIPRTKLP